MSIGDRVAGRVEQAAEDAGEGQHVVDLVGQVAAPAGDDGGVLGRPPTGSTSGTGLARAKTIAPVGHGGDVVAGEDVRRGHADEHVGAGEDVAQGAGAARRRWCARRPSTSSAARPSRPAWMTPSLSRDDDVPRPRPRAAPSRIAMPAAPAPDSTMRTSGERLADDLQRVGQGGEHHDRGAVLVVVEDRDVEAGPQPALDLEAARRRDVLEVDARRRPARSARPSARSRRRPGCRGRSGTRRSRRTA